uniref:Uncharacterized protein n=1 Tax=Aliivibrio fischeri TaxID=668 RepID=H2ES78_ALIFS|nr:hypothetical protein [Aliivibrio fischeri]AEY78245.1 hypothetical protein [Aliivibrio fischeri]
MNRKLRQQNRARSRRFFNSTMSKNDEVAPHHFILAPPEPGIYVSLINNHQIIVENVLQDALERYQVVIKPFDEGEQDWNTILSEMEWGALNHMYLYQLKSQEAA